MSAVKRKRRSTDNDEALSHRDGTAGPCRGIRKTFLLLVNIPQTTLIQDISIVWISQQNILSNKMILSSISRRIMRKIAIKNVYDVCQNVHLLNTKNNFCLFILLKP